MVWELWMFMDWSLGMRQLKDLAAGETRLSRLSASETVGSGCQLRDPYVCI